MLKGSRIAVWIRGGSVHTKPGVLRRLVNGCGALCLFVAARLRSERWQELLRPCA